jgi:hypothetical protein
MLLVKGTILVIALAVIVGWFHQHLEEFFRWALSLVQEPFHLLSDGLVAVMTSLRNWIRAQMGAVATAPQPTPQSSEATPSDAAATPWNPLAAGGVATPGTALTAGAPASPSSGPDAVSPRQHLQYIIGSVLYTAIFLVFIYADFWVAVFTFQAFGIETVATKIPASAALLFAAALIGVAVYWGLMLLDQLGVTHLAPWDRLGLGARRMMVRLAWASIALSLVLCLLLGIWRGVTSTSSAATQVSDTMESPAGSVEVASPGREATQALGTHPSEAAGILALGEESHGSAFERIVPTVAMGLLPVLLTISAVWSGLGVAMLFHYLVVILAGIMLVPLALLNLVMRIMMALCNATFGAIGAVLRLLHSMGRALIEFFRPIYDWLQARMRRSLGEGGSSVPPPPARAGIGDPPVGNPDAPAWDSVEQSRTDEPDDTGESEESPTAWNPFAMSGGTR